MKIALIAEEFFPDIGGISQNFNSFCKSFRYQKHKLFVFNPNYKGKRIFKIFDNNEYTIKDLVFFIKNKKLIYYLLLSLSKIISDKQIKFAFRLRMAMYLFVKPKILIQTIKNISSLYLYFKKLDIDIIFGGASSGNVLTVIYILSRMFKTKVISYAHGNEFLVRSSWSLKTFYLKSLDKVILSNNTTKHLIKKINHLKDTQLNVIHYGLILKEYEIKQSKEELRKNKNISDEKFILISIGRHVSRKKFDLVIKAIYEIKKKTPSIDLKYFLIGGGAETANLKKLTNQLDLENEVEFLGAFAGKKKNEFLKLSDVFLMPSIAEKESIEGFGIVFLEANYYKVPVIGSRSGGIVEAIQNKKTGLLINPNNLQDLVEAILYLYENKEKRIEMGENGYNRVIKEFNWSVLIEIYIKFFEELLK